MIRKLKDSNNQIFIRNARLADSPPPSPPHTPRFPPRQLRVTAGVPQVVVPFGVAALGAPLASPLAQAFYYGAAAAGATPYGVGLDHATLKDLIKKQM